MAPTVAQQPLAHSSNSNSLISTVESASTTAASPSPSITLSQPTGLVPASPSRSRSASPSSPTTRSRSTSGIDRTISPRSSTVFASRPSPVVPSPSVPSSPSFSRPTSPDGRARRQFGSGDGVALGLDRFKADLAPEAGAGAPDLTHIFERDVEFASARHLTPSEAIDVAVAPVLSEAAVALSTSTSLSSSELQSIVRESEEVGPGWESPARGRSRGVSPETSHPASPLSRGSYSLSIPPAELSPSTAELAQSNPSLLLSSTPPSPALDPPARRLSFTSWADCLNEERMAELTGAPIGESGNGGGVVSMGALEAALDD